MAVMSATPVEFAGSWMHVSLGVGSLKEGKQSLLGRNMYLEHHSHPLRTFGSKLAVVFSLDVLK